MSEAYSDWTPESGLPHPIEIIGERRRLQEIEMRKILTQYYLGNQSKVDLWFTDPNPAFGGQIPNVALLQRPDEVYQHVVETKVGYVDEDELKRPPEGPSYDLPPPKSV